MAQQQKPKAATDDSAQPLEGEINPAAGQTIDERMAALHADHVAMGARPADDAAPTTPAATTPERSLFAKALDERDQPK